MIPIRRKRREQALLSGLAVSPIGPIRFARRMSVRAPQGLVSYMAEGVAVEGSGWNSCV